MLTIDLMKTINFPATPMESFGKVAELLSCQRTLASILWIPAFAGMTTQASGY